MDYTTAGRSPQKKIAGKVSASDILASVRISDAARVLTGMEPRHGRIPAPWRRTRDCNVSLSDTKGTWFDHVEGQGGGTLDFIARVRGSDRQGALRWLAALAGVALDGEPLSLAARARWAEERRALERDLPAARYWRRAAVSMAEELLNSLKAALFEPTLPQPGIDEIGHVENMLAALRHKDGAPLVAECRWWLEHHPGLTAAMVRAAKHREQAQRRALLAYLGQTPPGAGKVAA